MGPLKRITHTHVSWYAGSGIAQNFRIKRADCSFAEEASFFRAESGTGSARDRFFMMVHPHSASPQAHVDTHSDDGSELSSEVVIDLTNEFRRYHIF